MKHNFCQFFLFILLILPLSFTAQMSGEYIVGPAGSYPTPDYNVIQDALDDLYDDGIDGPVTVRINDGIYDESLNLFQVAGVSDINTITIESSSLDASLVTVQPISAAASVAVFGIHCSDVVCQNITFEAVSTSNTIFYVISASSADNLKFENNIVLCSLVGLSYIVEVYEGEGVQILNNEIASEGVLIERGIYCHGTSNPLISGNTISEVNVGVLMETCDDIIIEDNFINCQGVGVSSTSSSKITIERNSIIVDGSYSYTRAGMLVSCYNDDYSNDVFIANNMISVFETGQGIYLLLQTFDFSENTIEAKGIIDHNSIYMGQTSISGGGSAINIGCESGFDLRISANSIKLEGMNLTGLNYSNPDGGAWPRSDYNNVWRIGGAGTNYYGVYKQLWKIRNLTGMEMHSIILNPKYFSNTDLHIEDQSGNINRSYINPDVLDDFDKDDRPQLVLKYDIGADEAGNGWNKTISVKENNFELDEKSIKLIVTPNPTADFFRLEFENNDIHDFQIYTTQGRFVLDGKLTSGEQIDMTNLANGIYIIKVPTLTNSSVLIEKLN